MSATVRAGRRAVNISSPNKKLIGGRGGLTKLELAEHLVRVAPLMVPLVRDRPLALQVFPRGIEAGGHYMKEAPSHFPDWVARATVAKRGGRVTHVLANDAATLAYLAGQNALTPHVWLSRADQPRRPDRLIVDFDPSPGARFADIRAAAREAGERLRNAGLAPFAMATGSRGLHVVCPLRRGSGFEAVHGFARALAESLVRDSPKQLTLEWLKADRGSRIYVDVNRIAYAQHAVAPYGVRARPGGPVALPLHWEELSEGRLRPDRWKVGDVPARLESEGDPWKGMARRARKLPT